MGVGIDDSGGGGGLFSDPSTLIPIILGALGGLGGGFGNRGGTSTQTGTGNSSGTSAGTTAYTGGTDQTNSGTSTSTTTSNLSPQQSLAIQTLLGGLTKQAGTDTDLTGYKAAGLQGINQNYDIKNQLLRNMMSARGLSYSPASVTPQLGLESQRLSELQGFQNQIPLLQRQMKQQGLQSLAQGLSVVPVDKTTTGATTGTQSSTTSALGSSGNTQSQTSNNTVQGTTPGNVLGGIFQGLTGALAPILGSIFGKKTGTAGGTGNIGDLIKIIQAIPGLGGALGGGTSPVGGGGYPGGAGGWNQYPWGGQNPWGGNSPMPYPDWGGVGMPPDVWSDPTIWGPVDNPFAGGGYYGGGGGWPFTGRDSGIGDWVP